MITDIQLAHMYSVHYIIHVHVDVCIIGRYKQKQSSLKPNLTKQQPK